MFFFGGGNCLVFLVALDVLACLVTLAYLDGLAALVSLKRSRLLDLERSGTLRYSLKHSNLDSYSVP